MATLPFSSAIKDTVNSITTNVPTGVTTLVGSAAALAATNLGSLVTSAINSKLAPTANTLSRAAWNSSVSRLSTAGFYTDLMEIPNVPTSLDDDWRVRISVGPESGIFYLSNTPGIMAPLVDTNGVIFPYTPQIQVSYQNAYTPVPVTHSINTVQAYQNSDISSISITGVFTAQNYDEAAYVLAALHFFKSASKMFFGSSSNSDRLGSPPPILFLNGFGQHYFPNVPTIMTTFNHSITDDVDFIEAAVGSEVTRVPTSSSFSITLIPQYSRNMIKSFDLDKFAAGELIRNNGRFM